ncbi:hypothetical protein VSR82_39045 [Burkholderia sp. JPY481]|uniref:hypothetical protein n=1 Tax=Paraburkholderia sp. EG304 TaxID=3237015 RepID=UPI00317A0576
MVFVGCREKFAQSHKLRSVLLATAPTVMVDASPYDRIRGVGLGEWGVGPLFQFCCWQRNISSAHTAVENRSLRGVSSSRGGSSRRKSPRMLRCK